MARPSTTNLRTTEADNDTEALFRRLRATSDAAEARRIEEELVARHLGLCDRRAARYAGRGIPYEDLVQVARVGLVVSVRRYRPEEGTSFLRFALPTISGEVKRYFRDHGWTVRPPRRIQELSPRVRAVREQWEHEHGRTPRPADLAGALDVQVCELAECLAAEQNFHLLSLDLTYGDGERPTLGEQLPTRHRELDSAADRLTLREALGTLSGADRELVRLRFVEGLTQKEIGDRLGVSQMQVSRLVQSVLRRLRSLMGVRPARRERIA
ncbi:MAG: sigma-70 family RNA polymerase sigma factor [Intrasporangium sp.]|uniref:sigma-70 family RNA polymerase sigma factor n=1 Tax=Intrasporangium sp. TaxID=1925024 RepID=UPI003F821643